MGKRNRINSNSNNGVLMTVAVNSSSSHSSSVKNNVVENSNSRNTGSVHRKVMGIISKADSNMAIHE